MGNSMEAEKRYRQNPNITRFKKIKKRVESSECEGLTFRMVKKEGDWYARLVNNGGDMDCSPNSSTFKDILDFLKNSHSDVLWLVERLENNSRVLMKGKIDGLEKQIIDFKEANRRIYSKYRALKESINPPDDNDGGLLLSL